VHRSAAAAAAVEAADADDRAAMVNRRGLASDRSVEQVELTQLVLTRDDGWGLG
jgi:hypothetical protein